MVRIGELSTVVQKPFRLKIIGMVPVLGVAINVVEIRYYGGPLGDLEAHQLNILCGAAWCAERQDAAHPVHLTTDRLHV